ncbi:MAG: RDD domain containing protein [Microgenomates group bacterium GW2011_GWC1_39_7b]|uniref:RDD domain containing protein n=3 Tax=Candidatus Woeseibacteriota TaxID=1752722 RepID=A0A0G0LJN5_9BACT|nr:MAG: RDD domain containing protein [Candidatus Woesebacteria bacterium GW2011_GWB1_39_10]KKR26847.1 MAG: RDD domain containing protein [Microgenomates group bacterium GW2011_GWC1_39_7b]KKR73186.1 MAG: RDD domain containing protein [Candidatus Woesebacteria bacterium GW2011_GWA2_40_7]KKS91063.1 MAG: RDD domain containing protein [Candidatus Woesebacteria bacterium GW2011_GWA1_43_12]
MPQENTPSPIVSQPQPQVDPQAVSAAGTVVYAGFWARLGASVLDGLIIGVVSFVINLVMGIVTTVAGGGSASSVVAVVSMVVSLIFFVLELVYFIYFIGAKGQTLGKMALKIKVVRAGTNEAPGYLKAFLREVVGKFISSFVFLLGFLWMLWDKNKQTWHDKIAGTVVVKV